jgi:signal transduction histidine kinase
VKHAHATEATLSLHSRAGWLELQARDNGRGFDPAQPSTQEGMGLQALRDRVKLLNGQFRIRSSPKNGTLVNILIPQAANPR